MPQPRQCTDSFRALGILWSLTSHSRFARNAVTSSFFRFSREIRDKIYSGLLGDRLVHIKYVYDFELLVEKGWSEGLRPEPWNHVVCEADCPENEETCWPRQHHSCDHRVVFGDAHKETLPLGILRSCRQMYNEAGHIPWSINTSRSPTVSPFYASWKHEASSKSVR